MDIDCWDGIGVGFGECGIMDVGLIERFEDIIYYFCKRVFNGLIMFNFLFMMFLLMFKRYFFIVGGVDCVKEGKLGKFLVSWMGVDDDL